MTADHNGPTQEVGQEQDQGTNSYLGDLSEGAEKPPKWTPEMELQFLKMAALRKAAAPMDVSSVLTRMREHAVTGHFAGMLDEAVAHRVHSNTHSWAVLEYLSGHLGYSVERSSFVTALVLFTALYKKAPAETNAALQSLRKAHLGRSIQEITEQHKELARTEDTRREISRMRSQEDLPPRPEMHWSLTDALRGHSLSPSVRAALDAIAENTHAGGAVAQELGERIQIKDAKLVLSNRSDKP